MGGKDGSRRVNYGPSQSLAFPAVGLNPSVAPTDSHAGREGLRDERSAPCIKQDAVEHCTRRRRARASKCEQARSHETPAACCTYPA